jgi:hypothetical protein
MVILAKSVQSDKAPADIRCCTIPYPAQRVEMQNLTDLKPIAMLPCSARASWAELQLSAVPTYPN